SVSIENPIKNHFIAYVKMDPNYSALLKSPSPDKNNPVKHTLALENLRQKFKWPHFTEPTFNYQILNKNKGCLYFETPPGLDQNLYEEWCKAVLKLKTGVEDIPFTYSNESRKYQTKPRFKPFVVDPQKITTPQVHIFYPQIQLEQRKVSITSNLNQV